jgi:hypothetical protein
LAHLAKSQPEPHPFNDAVKETFFVGRLLDWSFD